MWGFESYPTVQNKRFLESGVEVDGENLSCDLSDERERIIFFRNFGEQKSGHESG